MVQPIYTHDIARYKDDIKRNGIEGVIRTYSDLLDKGHGYAGWAKGVAEASGLNTGGLGGTITGRAAVLFMKNTSGREFSQAELNSIRVGMAYGYLAVLERNVERGGGQTQTQVRYDEARDFHREVFRQHRLTIDNWTLETPMKLIGRYEGGPAAQEAQWQKLMKTEGDWVDALFASDGLYGKVADYADGYISRDRSGKVVGVNEMSNYGIYSREKISEVDRKAAEHWVKHVSIYKPFFNSRQEGMDSPDQYHAYAGLKEGALSEMGEKALQLALLPQSAQTLYEQGRACYIAFCEKKNMAYTEDQADRVAMSMAAAGLPKYMEGISKMNIKEDGQLIIGHNSPHLRMASLDMVKAETTPVEESMKQIQETAQRMDQEALARQMERTQSNGMVMS